MPDDNHSVQEIYKKAWRQKIWVWELGLGFAAAGCLIELNRLEKRLGRKIDISKLRVVDCFNLGAVPATAATREEACQRAVEEFKKLHQRHKKQHCIGKNDKVNAASPKIVFKQYDGVIDGWFETGTEGLVWTLYENGKQGYEGMRIVEKGDHLKVFAEDGSVIFNDVIVPDYKIGWRAYPGNRRYGQPAALGYWIHWTQKGWRPDDWARLFLPEKNKHLRAILTKKILIKEKRPQ